MKMELEQTVAVPIRHVSREELKITRARAASPDPLALAREHIQKAQGALRELERMLLAQALIRR